MRQANLKLYVTIFQGGDRSLTKRAWKLSYQITKLSLVEIADLPHLKRPICNCLLQLFITKKIFKKLKFVDMLEFFYGRLC